MTSCCKVVRPEGDKKQDYPVSAQGGHGVWRVPHISRVRKGIAAEEQDQGGTSMKKQKAERPYE